MVASAAHQVKFGGWRAVSLFGLAIFALSRAVIYLPLPSRRAEVPASIQAITEGSPLTVTGWGVLWACAAAFLVLGAFTPRVSWALVSYLFMTTAAAGVYLFSWVTLFPPDNGEWASGLMYAGLAVATFGLIKVDARQAELHALLVGLSRTSS